MLTLTKTTLFSGHSKTYKLTCCRFKELRFFMKNILLIFSIAIGGISNAQTSPELNSADILVEMNRLNTVGSVLYIAAHPDDENTRLLGYLAKEKNLRTGYLSLTRGDGGQNLIGIEQGEGLGLIRTQELLAARRTDGAEQFFTRANDFGYSKNPEETFTIWNKDSILSDVVLAIRKFRPDVIICRFPTTGEGGHGHHTASAILAEEAFIKAADPTQFPNQLKQTAIWQAKRIFWNTFNFGGTNTTSSDQLTLDVGAYNPLLGKSFGQIAAESRSMHKSQGFGSTRQRGSNIEYFKLLDGDKADKDVFQGIDHSWNRFSATKAIGQLTNTCIANYNPQHPEKSIDALIKIYTAIQKLDEKDVSIRYWKHVKLEACKNLIVQCAGLWMEVAASDYSVVPGSEIDLKAEILARNPSTVKLKSISFSSLHEELIGKELTINTIEKIEVKEKIAQSTSYSAPYWLVEDHPHSMYIVRNEKLIGQPENAAALNVVFHINVNGIDLDIERGVSYKETDPVKGEVYRPFEVLPPATVNISDEVIVFSDNQPKNISLTIKANTANVNGKLQIAVPSGWKIDIAEPNFKLTSKGDEQIIQASITPVSKSVDGLLQPSLTIDGKEYSKSIQRIDYDHIPSQFILRDASSKIVFVDLKKTGQKIGYIPGAGDKVAASLKQVGYDVTELTDDLLAKSDLSQFDAIVTGIRAFNTNDRLPVYHEKFMNYVKQGGNMIVQYNTNNRFDPIDFEIGPYPFVISRNRVTVDDAEVRFANPTHPVLNSPNKITQADFDNWIQERGIYFASDFDSNYETIFSMNDPNEDPNEGSLIIGKYGKGNFVYTGLVFFRELPAGVPGAFRLFVNLLSLPQNK